MTLSTLLFFRNALFCRNRRPLYLCPVVSFLWPPCVQQMRTLYFCPVVSSSIFFSFLAYSQLSQIGCLLYFHTWCGLNANLECRTETCYMRLAENTGRKRSSKIRHLLTITQLCRAMSSQLRHISTTEKKLLNSNISLTCRHNMANFGPLAAEIVSLVWGTPANFNGFRVCAGLLHGTLLVGVSQTLRR